MKTTDFLKELKELDSRLDIVPNPARTAFEQKCGQGLSNIKLDGIDICPVPSDEMQLESNPHYYYVFPNGMIAPHVSVIEARDRVKKTLAFISTPEGKDVFFDKE